MKRKINRISRELRELLSDTTFDRFTVLQLRDEFIARYGLCECSNSSELRKSIYRRIMRLTAKGYLIKYKSGNDQAVTVYQVTDLLLQDLRQGCYAFESTTPAKTKTEYKAESQLDGLKCRLNQHQVDMLACAGECREYQHLAADYPHLQDQIEPMFRSARERSSELMGQVRAITNLLNRSTASE